MLIDQSNIDEEIPEFLKKLRLAQFIVLKAVTTGRHFDLQSNQVKTPSQLVDEARSSQQRYFACRLDFSLYMENNWLNRQEFFHFGFLLCPQNNVHVNRNIHIANRSYGFMLKEVDANRLFKSGLNFFNNSERKVLE